jgi:hypothetical protein
VNGPRGINKQWEGDFLLKIDILEAHTSMASDQFGPITGGFLRIRGRLLPLKLHALYKRDYNGHLLYDGYLQVTTSKTERYKIWVNADEGMEPGEPIEQDLFYMPVESAIFSKSECAVTGLLLRKTGKKKGEFRRFGLGKKWNDHKFYDRVVTGYGNPPIQSEQFEEEGSDGTYVFTIV